MSVLEWVLLASFLISTAIAFEALGELWKAKDEMRDHASSTAHWINRANTATAEVVKLEKEIRVLTDELSDCDGACAEYLRRLNAVEASRQVS